MLDPGYFSPLVGMTSTGHIDDRTTCMDTGGRAMQGAIAERSCFPQRGKIPPSGLGS